MYLDFSSFNDSGMKLLSCSISIWTIGKCYKTKTFGASFIKNDLHIKDRAKFLKKKKKKMKN